MAEKVGSVILNLVKDECNSLTCPFRAGDGDAARKELRDKVEKKLEFRVSDGKVVREKERRIKQLETALSKVIELASSRKLTLKEIQQFKTLATFEE